VRIKQAGSVNDGLAEWNTVNEKTYVEDFLGTGGQLLVTLLVGYLLTIITAGIYGPWFICKLYKFELENLVFNDK